LEQWVCLLTSSQLRHQAGNGRHRDSRANPASTLAGTLAEDFLRDVSAEKALHPPTWKAECVMTSAAALQHTTKLSHALHL